MNTGPEYVRDAVQERDLVKLSRLLDRCVDVLSPLANCDLEFNPKVVKFLLRRRVDPDRILVAAACSGFVGGMQLAKRYGARDFAGALAVLSDRWPCWTASGGRESNRPRRVGASPRLAAVLDCESWLRKQILKPCRKQRRQILKQK